MENNNKTAVFFAATNKYIDDVIITPAESHESGKDWITWGDGNKYPQYLESLRNECPTLRAIIGGNVDFIAGDGVSANYAAIKAQKINKAGDTLEDVVRAVADDEETYGARAYNIIRNIEGGIAEVYPVSVARLRLNERGDVFYYSDKWANGYVKRADVVTYPAFIPSLNWAALTPEQKVAMSSTILYVKTGANNSVYPSPVYAAAVKACEMERQIDDFHLAALANGFAPSVIINFNNGCPEDEQREEIERNINAKYNGAGNAGRPVLAFNIDRDHAATFEKLDITDFGVKYESLAKHSRQQIFTSFRAVPALFGLMTETTGFSSQEFAESFKLYNRTQIRPVQRRICDDFDYIYGVKGAITITPFSLDTNGESGIS